MTFDRRLQNRASGRATRAAEGFAAQRNKPVTQPEKSRE